MSKVKTDVADTAAAATARPRMLVRRGRGRLGGSTFLDAVAQDAFEAGRNPLIADAARNPTLSTLYPAATKPKSDALADVKDWLSDDVLSVMVAEGRSCGLDMGGGQDDRLDDYGRDLNLVGFCEEMGVTPVAAYLLGPDPDDFEHALAVRDAGGFRPKQELLIMNEGVLRRGEDPAGAFGRIQANPDFVAWVNEGARPIYMRSLPCLPDIRRLGLTLAQASRNEATAEGKLIGMPKSFMTREWRKKLRVELANVSASEWVL